MLDGLDGRIARALKGTSRFGAELDSLADFVDFGVAPGVRALSLRPRPAQGLRLAGGAGVRDRRALRLARFNVMIDDPDMPAWRKAFFVGMPAPAGAVVGLLPVYVRFLGERGR